VSEANIPDLGKWRQDDRTCPKCKKGRMCELYGAIGGFPGHEFVHPGPLVKRHCPNCGYDEPAGQAAKKKFIVALLDRIIGGLNRLRSYFDSRS